MGNGPEPVHFNRLRLYNTVRNNGVHSIDEILMIENITFIAPS